MIAVISYSQKNITKNVVGVANLAANIAPMDMRKTIMYKLFKNIIIYGFCIGGLALSIYFKDIGNNLLALIFLIISVGYFMSAVFRKSQNKVLNFVIDLTIITGFTCLISYILIDLLR